MPDQPEDIVYIVDDDDSVCQAIELLLMSEHFNVKSFRSAAECLESDLENHNSCLLIDIDMKEIGGLELQKRLLEDGLDIPVIFFSAVDSPVIRQQAKLAGAIGYFQKPLDAQAVLDVIRWALSEISKTNNRYVGGKYEITK